MADTSAPTEPLPPHNEESSTITLVQRLASLQLMNYHCEPVSQSVIENIPEVQQVLSSIDTPWDELSAFFQRALIWDLGFISAGRRDAPLSRVNVTCGETMENIMVPKATLQRKCSTQQCANSMSGTDGQARAKNCRNSDIIPLTRCAAMDHKAVSSSMNESLGNNFTWTDVPDVIPMSSIWAEEDKHLKLVPYPRSILHMDGTSNMIYGIHLVVQEPMVGDCPTRFRPGDLIVPCRVFEDQQVTNSVWCAPKQSKFMLEWIKDPNNPPQYTKLNNNGTSPQIETKQAHQTDSITLIAVLGAAFAVLAIAAVTAFVMLRKKRKISSAFEDVIVLSSPQTKRDSAVYMLERMQSSSQDIAAVRKGGDTSRALSFIRDEDHDSNALTMSSSSFHSSRGVGSSSSNNHGARSTRYGTNSVEQAISSFIEYVNPLEIVQIRTIGAGSFGEVLLGRYDGEYVAIKKLHPYSTSQLDIHSFHNEIALLKSFNHPNIIRFIGVTNLIRKRTNSDGEYSAQNFSDNNELNNSVALLTDYMELGDLTDVLSIFKDENNTTKERHVLSATENFVLRQKPRFSWTELKTHIAMDILRGLDYLHTFQPTKIIHRDIKSRNILLDSNFEAKLTDFGASKEYNSQTMSSRGSNLWLAPEIIRGERYDEKVDIFSFGIVITELSTLEVPYHNIRTQTGQKLLPMGITHHVAHKNLRPTLSSTCPGPIKKLFDKCVLDNPKARPSAAEAVGILQKFLAEDVSELS